MRLNGALGIASGGLANIGFGLTVISQNIANASTPQYAVESATQQSLSTSGQELGVRSGIVLRATDPGLQSQVSSQVAQNAAAQTIASALTNMQPALGSVGSGNDLGSQLTAVQSAFSTLLGDPGDATQQAAVVDSAVALSNNINTLSQNYVQQRQIAQNGLVADVQHLNTSLSTMGTLSAQIVEMRAQGQSTADLENQRDQAENTISQLVDARFIDQPNGDVTVLTVGGVQLPTGRPPQPSMSDATVGATASYPGGGLPGITLGGLDVTSQLTGGSIGARLTLRDSTLPTYQASLDQFAQTLSARFADQGLSLFTDPAGTVPASTGSSVQDGYVGYSGVIQVNPAVVANPALVRDGTQAVTGNPAGASAFSPNPTGLTGFSSLISRVLTFALGNQVQAGVPQPSIATGGLGVSGTLSASFGPQATLGDYANSLTASQASDSANATTLSDDSKGVLTSLQGKMTAETGVSMDTELGQMVVLQNAYGANAKIIGAVEAMFTEALAMVT